MVCSLVCAGVFQPMPVERSLHSAAAVTRQHSLGCKCDPLSVTRQCSLGCKCESAVVPAAFPAALHAGGSRASDNCAEPAARLGQPSAWSRLNGWREAHNSICSSRCNNLIYGARPRRCLQLSPARRVGAAEREGCHIACSACGGHIAVLNHTFWLLHIVLYSSVISHLPAVM